MAVAESKPFQVNRCSVDSITLFEITEQELDLLEQGSPSSTLLNFAIFSLSVGISFLVTLLTVTIEDTHSFIVFVVATIIGLLAGLILLVVWKKMSRSTRSITSRIRARRVDSAQAPDLPMVQAVAPTGATESS